MTTMCRALDVSPSGFYARCKRPFSPRVIADDKQFERIRSFHATPDSTYGVQRFYEDLAEEGAHVGHERIARLMRKFVADAPNQLWVADIRYIPT